MMPKQHLVMVFLVCLWLAPLPARAQEVTVFGEVIMRLDSAEDAARLSERIESLISAGGGATAVSVRKLPNGFGLYWGDSLLLVVTRELAAANQSQPEALAGLWARRLRTLAEQGGLHLKPSRLELPVGGQSTVAVTGLTKGQFMVEDPSGRVEIFEESPEALRVVGKVVGKSKITIQRGKAKAVLIVHVKDWAGFPPEQVSVQVVGDPAPGALVAEAALREAQGKTRVNPGCTLTYGNISQLPSIPRGQKLRFNLPIRIEGNENYYPVIRDLPVQVSSIDVEPVESNILLVSNRPEQVDQDGVLMEYTFSRKEPTRLMYSHMNASQGRRNLWVNVRNPDRQPVKLLVGWTFAGPSRNEVLVGHTAAERFLQNLGENAGYVLEVAPGAAIELAGHDLARKELISGFMNLRLLSGDRLTVEVRSAEAPSSNDGKPLPHLGAPFNPFKIHPHGVFAQPYYEEWLDFKPGQEPITVRFGESPWLIDFETGLPNTGNFGVLYRWHVTLNNPTSRPYRVGMTFVPVNGAGAGTFLVNQDVYSASFQRKGSQTPVAVFEVGPGQEKLFEIVTFPEASSNYPAELIFRELAPGEAFLPGTPVNGSSLDRQPELP